MADHVRERRRRVLRPWRAILGYADRRNTARVNNTTYTSLPGCVQDVACAFDVGSVELLGVECTQPVIRRDVEKRLAPGQRACQRRRVGQVSLDNFDGNTLEVAAIGALARQGTHLPTLLQQSSGNRSADETRRASDECPHERPTRATAASERFAAR